LAKIEGAVNTQVKAFLIFKGDTERSLQELQSEAVKTEKKSLIIVGVNVLNTILNYQYNRDELGSVKAFPLLL